MMNVTLHMPKSIGFNEYVSLGRPLVTTEIVDDRGGDLCVISGPGWPAELAKAIFGFYSRRGDADALRGLLDELTPAYREADNREAVAAESHEFTDANAHHALTGE